ncbi:putative glucose N-acetyltransferase 1 [Phytophthora infestans]|uniref:Putative glucose N-acetyltransferase 1 n=1 Tax=Phytophthora infestans TaxID=4787 RepID=A0A833TLJ4_PHYIN|nr:putative glucose N-acetyltransferase 1 [Phytophthora infestans]
MAPQLARRTHQKQFAYLFYVTSNTYACAAMQFIDRLINHFETNTSRIDVVVLHTRRVGARLLGKLQDRYHVRVIPVDIVKADAAEPTWKESLTKLRAFQNWGYDRIVFLDADAVPMTNLDHLFELPPAPLYAPMAYWLEQPFFASTLLVIEPSDIVFGDIIRWARGHGPAAGFDMDIFNKYFADSVQYLPGVYTVLNSDFRRAPNERSVLFNSTVELRENTRVVHFSCKPDGSYGKPWNWPSHDLSFLDDKPFDPLFRQLFEDYWKGEQELCQNL